MTQLRGTRAAVSVVIPCYRCVGTIARAVQSVANQTVLPSEILLIDDGSGDETLAALCALEQRHQGWVKVIALAQNAGPSHARNAGWAEATQPYIAFLDADDAWHPQKIAYQYGYMKEHPDVALCGHAHRILASEALPDWPLAADTEARHVTKRWLLRSNRFITPSVMLRRDVPQRFAERQHYMEDHLLWLEIVCSGGRAVRLSSELAAIYKSSFGVAGLSSSLWGMGKNDLGNYWRLYRTGYLLLAETVGWSVYSLLKFARRLLLYWGYLRWR